MSKLFASLSSDGFIKDRSIISKKLMEMFLASDKSQSNFKDAMSLKYILNTETINEYSKNVAIKKALEQLYAPYYDTVLVSVENNTSDDNIVAYSMQINTVYNGETYTIRESIADNYFSDIDKFDAAYLKLIK